MNCENELKIISFLLDSIEIENNIPRLKFLQGYDYECETEGRECPCECECQSLRVRGEKYGIYTLPGMKVIQRSPEFLLYLCETWKEMMPIKEIRSNIKQNGYSDFHSTLLKLGCDNKLCKTIQSVAACFELEKQDYGLSMDHFVNLVRYGSRFVSRKSEKAEKMIIASTAYDCEIYAREFYNCHPYGENEAIGTEVVLWTKDIITDIFTWPELLSNICSYKYTHMQCYAYPGSSYFPGHWANPGRPPELLEKIDPGYTYKCQQERKLNECTNELILARKIISTYCDSVLLENLAVDTTDADIIELLHSAGLHTKEEWGYSEISIQPTSCPRGKIVTNVRVAVIPTLVHNIEGILWGGQVIRCSPHRVALPSHKEDLDANVSTNAKATADLKTEVEDTIPMIKIGFKQDHTKDNSAQLDRLNNVQDVTKNLALELDTKLKGYNESASPELREAENNVQSFAAFRQDLDNKLAQHDRNCKAEHNSMRSKSHTLTKHMKKKRKKRKESTKKLLKKEKKRKHQKVAQPLKNKTSKFKCENQMTAKKEAQDMLLLLENLKGTYLSQDENMNEIIFKPMTVSSPPTIMCNKSVSQFRCDSRPAESQLSAVTRQQRQSEQTDSLTLGLYTNMECLYTHVNVA